MCVFYITRYTYGVPYRYVSFLFAITAVDSFTLVFVVAYIYFLAIFVKQSWPGRANVQRDSLQSDVYNRADGYYPYMKPSILVEMT